MTDFDAFDAFEVDRQTKSGKTFVTLMSANDGSDEYDNALEINAPLARDANKI